MKPQRPIIRYHGGKWRLAPWIISYFPDHKVYCEPFSGAASVLLRKERSYAEVLNDLDGEIVNLFRVARDHGSELLRALELTPFSRDEFSESYEPTACGVEQARRTVVRAYMGFGSNAHHRATGFRAKSHRSNTTPAHDWRAYPGKFGDIIERLQGVVIENRDALQVIETHDAPDTLFYVDPPYVTATRDRGSDYNHEMGDDEHRHLAAALNSVSGMVLLSGYDCPLYAELFAEWDRVECEALADGARKRTEVLWMRNLPVQADLFTRPGARKEEGL